MIQTDEGHFRKLFFANKHATIVYCMVFWSFGVCVGFLGPTLWDLGCQTGTTLPAMSWVFFSQSLFILIGSMLGGLAIETFSSNTVMAGSMLGILLTMASIPFSRSVQTLTLILALMGFSMGLVDTNANVSMLKLYKADVTPFLQALHFFYGLGAFLSPLIAEPFLTNMDCTRFISNGTSQQSWIERSEAKELASNSKLRKSLPKSLEEAQEMVHIEDAFWIMTAIQIPVIIAVVHFWCRVKTSKSEGRKSEDYTDLDNWQPLPTSSSTWLNNCWLNNSPNFICVVLIAAALLFFADGMQADFGDFVFSYGKIAVKDMTTGEAAYMNAAFWGTFASGRLLAIFAAVWFSPGCLLICDLAGSLSGVLLMLLFPHSHTMLYISTMTVGFFLSSIYPSTISLAEQFVDIGPSATSSIVVGAAAGEMFYPVLVGHLIDHYGPGAFLAVGIVTCSCMVGVFFLLMLAGLYSLKSKRARGCVSMFCPCFCSDDAELRQEEIHLKDTKMQNREAE